jgi:O-antigen ligase
MIYLIGGYMFLMIYRPFEVWPALAHLHIERVYIGVLILYWAFIVEKRWRQNRVSWAMATFWLVYFASWQNSPYRPFLHEGVEHYFLASIGFAFVVTSLRDERDLKLVILLLLCAMTIYMAHSLREYSCGRGVRRMGTWRMVGVDTTFNDPNRFAATVVYCLPLVWPLWTECRRNWHRLVLLTYIVLSCTCVMLTGSRTGFAGLLAIAVVMGILSKHRLQLAVLFALTAPLAWYCLPQDRQDRYLTLLDPSYGPENAQQSARGRVVGLKSGIELWKQNPVLGAGPNAFALAAGTGFQSHQLYGQVLGELGTIGALSFGALLLAFIGNTLVLRRFCRDHNELSTSFSARLSAAMTLAICLLLLFGFGTHNLYRCFWEWFGAFQVVAMYCLEQRRVGTDNEAACGFESIAWTNGSERKSL